MRIIGLTGTIGAGKSTVARWLAAHGVRHIDSDALVHRLYDTDVVLQEELKQRFGLEVVQGGRVHRPSLARVAFASPANLAALEAIVHPAVLDLRDRELAQARAGGVPACVVEAIKLVESGGSAGCDELWIVVAQEAVQLARLAARGVAEDEARRRIASQGSVASWTAAFLRESARLGRTRPVVVFDNSGSEAQGQALLRRLWPAPAAEAGAAGAAR